MTYIKLGLDAAKLTLFVKLGELLHQS